jgi:hypothetical protein
MVSIDLETEVAEGHWQRQEGLALERNHQSSRQGPAGEQVP